MSFRNQRWDLDTRILEIAPGIYLTIRALLEGVHIWGGIGSGKTSGSGKAIMEAVLRAGFGGVVCIAKHEEIERWIDCARKNGRGNSIIVFDASRGFNFLAYELARQGTQGLGNVVECLMHVLEAADHATGLTGQSPDPFWTQATRQWLNHALPVLYSAHGPGAVTVSRILDFITSAGTRPELYVDPEWTRTHYAGQTLRRLVENPALALPADVRDAMIEFWIRQYPAIPQKTQGNISISLTTKLDRFKHGRMMQCFCDKIDIVPEMAFGGAIILLAMPALTWNQDGIIGQQLFKYMFQRAVESRNAMGASQSERPLFLYADESQYFANSYDDSFLSTCRASRTAVIYLSQTISAYHAKFGKDQADAADGLVGKFGTQVFHLNACSKTNKYASELIGRAIHMRGNRSRSVGVNRSRGMNEGTNSSYGRSSGSGSSFGPGGGGWNNNSGSNSSTGANWGNNVGSGQNENTSLGSSEQMDFILEPRVFASELQSGGPRNGNIVSAVWFKAGASFAPSGANYLITKFRQ
jgi:hypothetical protein